MQPRTTKTRPGLADCGFQQTGVPHSGPATEAAQRLGVKCENILDFEELRQELR